MEQSTISNWTKLKEIITEIDGKISYADATGNTDSKNELVLIRNYLLKLPEEAGHGKITNECRKFHV